MFKFTNIALILFITTAINFIASVISWQRRHVRNGLYFSIGMIGITVWTMAAGLDYAAISIPAKVFFAKLEYTGYNIAFVFFAMFALAYAGYDEWLNRRPVQAFLLFVPLSNILLAWINEWHGWLWSGFVRSEYGENTVIFEHGPGFLWVSASGYLMITIIIGSLWLAWRRGSEFSRRQARILFFASLVPVIGNLLYLSQSSSHMGVDWTPISFSISSLLFLWALSGTRLLDLVPIAREKLVDSLGDGMIVLDGQGRIVDMNPSAIEIIGTAPEVFLGRQLDAFVHIAQPLANQPLEQEIRTELEIGSVEKRYFDVLVSPLFEGQTRAIGRLILFRDITEKKQAERSLEKARREAVEGEARFRRLLEDAPDAMLIVNRMGIITFANVQSELIFEYPKEEIIDRSIQILLPDRFSDIHAVHWATFFDKPKARPMGQGTDLEFFGRRKGGDEFPVEISLSPITVDGETLVIAAVRDVTAQRQIEKALETSEQNLRRLLESAPDAMFIVDPEGRITFANNKSEMMFGYSRSELIDQPIEKLMPERFSKVHHAHRASYHESPEARSADKRINAKLVGLQKDGLEFPVEISLNPFHTEEGAFVIAAVRDITERKRIESEREKLIEELDSKNSELERFSYAVSHDLRSPLVTLKGFLSFLKNDIAAGNTSRIQTDIQRMDSAMDLMQERVEDLLELSRAGRLTDNLEVIPVNDLVAEALELVHGRISQRGIQMRVQERLPAITGDRHRLLEVFQNLVDNAAKFMGDQPDPQIEIGQHGQERGNPIFFVKDNGVGIPPEHHERVFGVFNKLDPRAEGTGIGLSLVKKIIEAHGGRIWVESDTGKGSTFYFTLPRG